MANSRTAAERGAILGFRVDDIATAVAEVRAHGGTVSEPHREPYAMAAEGHDDQGIPFYLHEMPSLAGDAERENGEPWNGEVEGDVSYLTMVVSDLDAAHAFYGGVLGWTFNMGRPPVRVGQWRRSADRHDHPARGSSADTRRDRLLPRDDIICSPAGTAGGWPGPGGGAAALRLEALCADDQDIPFYLHQF